MDNSPLTQSIGVSTTPLPSSSGARVLSGFGGGANELAAGINSLTGIQNSHDNLDVMNARLEYQREAKLKEQQEKDANAFVTHAISQGAVQWDQHFEDASLNAAPGAPGFTSAYLGSYDKWAEQQLEAAPTSVAKVKLGEHLDTMRAQLASKAINFETTAIRSNRADLYTQSVDNWALLVAKNPLNYEYAADQLKTGLPDVGPEGKQKLEEYKVKKLNQAYAEGLIQSNPDAAYRTLSIGTPQGAAAPDVVNVPVQSKGDTSVASPERGIRNNNPGNIVKSDIPWNGKVASQDPKYEAFATPELGIRAMGKNLLSYQDKHQINTVQGIVSTWAPASDNNDVASYVNSVAKQVGVKPDEPIDLHKPAVLKALVTAIIAHENGVQPYSDGQIKTGTDAALSNTELPKPASTVVAPDPMQKPAVEGEPLKTGSPIDNFSLEERLHYAEVASTAAHKMQMEARGGLEATVKNDIAQSATGAGVAHPQTMDTFVRAYGQADGPLRFSEYRDNLQLGTNISMTGTMPDADQDAMYKRMKPIAGSPTYAEDQRRYELMGQAIEEARKQRVADPMEFAIQKGMGANQIDFNAPEGIAQELANRSVLARQMNNNFHTPLALLSKQEASVFNQVLNNAPTSQKLVYLRQIRAAVQDPFAYRSVIQQIAPDSPVTAAAGVIIAKQTPVTVPHWLKDNEVFTQSDTAGIMLEGEALMNKSKAVKSEDGKSKGFPMPAEMDIRTAFNNEVGKAFAGDPNGADTAYQAAKAYYAGMAARNGDVSGTIDSTLMDKAVRAVTGGKANFNGSDVIVPWGMDTGDFKDIATAAIVNKLGKSPAAQAVGSIGLQNAGDGVYLLRNGAGYLTDDKGTPYKIDLYHEDGNAPGAPLPVHRFNTQMQSGLVHRMPKK